MELNLGREPGLEGWKVSKAGAWQGLKERLSQDRPFPSRPSDETTILAASRCCCGRRRRWRRIARQASHQSTVAFFGKLLANKSEVFLRSNLVKLIETRQIIVIICWFFFWKFWGNWNLKITFIFALNFKVFPHIFCHMMGYFRQPRRL